MSLSKKTASQIDENLEKQEHCLDVDEAKVLAASVAGLPQDDLIRMVRMIYQLGFHEGRLWEVRSKLVKLELELELKDVLRVAVGGKVPNS